jgi:3',5'-cyclic AMP phosphodiesterase CpdA
MEILGGIGNLYLQTLLTRRPESLEVLTYETFAWHQVYIRDIRREIRHCSGIDTKRAKVVLQLMQKVLLEAFIHKEMVKPKRGLLLEPLGIFHMINPRTKSYVLTLSDPALQNYSKFLLPYANRKRPIASIIHISDLHFSSKFTTDEGEFIEQHVQPKGIHSHSYQAAVSLSIRVNQILQNRKRHKIPTVVIVTGDVTRIGRDREFQVAVTFLKGEIWVGARQSWGLNLKENDSQVGEGNSPALFYIPGNHDTWKLRFGIFNSAYRSYFPDAFPTQLTIVTGERIIQIYGLDSTHTSLSRYILARGEVPPEQINGLEVKISRTIRKQDVRIACLHHPLIDLPGPTMELENHRNVGQSLNFMGMDLVLSGHIHNASSYQQDQFKPNHAIAGTATQKYSNRNFLLLDIYRKQIILQGFNQHMGKKQFEPGSPEDAFTITSDPS